jgi:hypothetical protein
MHQAKPADKEIVVNILSDSFRDNNMNGENYEVSIYKK